MCIHVNTHENTYWWSGTNFEPGGGKIVNLGFCELMQWSVYFSRELLNSGTFRDHHRMLMSDQITFI